MDMARVYQALGELQEEFLAEPGLFFNEHDAASRCYTLIQEALDYEMVELADGVWTCLLHHDYPAPVRCEPEGSEFAAKAGSDKDSQDGEYQRVQYDLVVFNPAYLNWCSYELAIGENFQLLREKLPWILERLDGPAILLGIEFVLNRTPFASEEEARQWCEKVERAYEKLRMSLVYEGKPFMENIMMLAFDAAGGEYKEMIEKRLGRCEGLVYCGV